MQFIWETNYGTDIFAHYLIDGKYEGPFSIDFFWEGLSGADN